MKKALLLFVTLCLLICSACSLKNDTKSISEAESSRENSEIEFTTEIPVTEESTEESTQESTEDKSEWKEAYSDYINGLPHSSDYERYDLIDLDNNGIPELIFDSGIDLGGGSLSGFANGTINTVPISSGGTTYCKNCIYTISGRQGMYEEKVVEVEDGLCKCIFEGKLYAQSLDFDMDNPDDFIYSYRLDETGDFQNVSYDDYSAAFSELYDKNNEREIDYQYDLSDIINAITNY